MNTGRSTRVVKQLLPAALHAPLGQLRRYVAADAVQRRLLRLRLRRHMFFGLAKRYTPALVVDWPEGRFIVNTWDEEVGRKTFRDGPYDADVLELVIQRLKELLPGFTVAGHDVLEVGANVGTTTIPLINRFGAARVLAFEPAPHNRRLLAATVAANGLEDRVQLRGMALSDRIATEAMIMNPGNSGDYRILVDEDGQPPAAFGAGGEDRWQTVNVEVTTLDRLIDEGDISLERVRLAWIDTQGHEPYVLAGAQRLLASNIPLFIEYWPYGLDQAGGLGSLERLLAEHYDVFCEPDNGSLRSTRELPSFAAHRGDFRWWTNIILLRQEWLEA
jgi:FkbM family methyltransferase